MKSNNTKKFSEIQNEIRDVWKFGSKSKNAQIIIKNKIDNIINWSDRYKINTIYLTEMLNLSAQSGKNISAWEIQKAYIFWLDKILMLENKKQKNDKNFKFDEKIINKYSLNFVNMFREMIKSEQTKNNIIEMISKSHIYKYDIIETIENKEIPLKWFEWQKYSNNFTTADILRICTQNNNIENKLNEILTNIWKISKMSLRKYWLRANWLQFFGEKNIIDICKYSKNENIEEKIKTTIEDYKYYKNTKIKVDTKSSSWIISEKEIKIIDFIWKWNSLETALNSNKSKIETLIKNYNASLRTDINIHWKSKNLFDLFWEWNIKKLSLKNTDFDDKVKYIVTELNKITIENLKASKYKSKTYGEFFSYEALIWAIIDGWEIKNKLEKIVKTKKTPSIKTWKFVYR